MLTALSLGCCLLVLTAAQATPGKSSKIPRSTKAAPRPEAQPQPSAGPATPVAEPRAPGSLAGTAIELLAQARKDFDALEYDQAAVLARAALDRPGLDPEERLDAFLIQGSCLAVTADPISAEASFRLLLRARPDFTLPASTSPKILSVFEKVRAEERVIVESVRAVARKRLVADLQLLNEPPSALPGGRPVRFALRLKDPTGAVSSFEVPYRRRGEPAYSMLALQRDPEGLWRGSIPGEWAASPDGFSLEYYLVTRDDGGPLLQRGDAATPLVAAVSPGSPPRSRPVPPWALATGIVATCLAGVASGGLAVATKSAEADYNAYASRGLDQVIDGQALAQKERFGRDLAATAIGTAVAAGVLAVVTLAIAPFTHDGDAEAP